jgi:hypothetical protein
MEVTKPPMVTKAVVPKLLLIRYNLRFFLLERIDGSVQPHALSFQLLPTHEQRAPSGVSVCQCLVRLFKLRLQSCNVCLDLYCAPPCAT